MRVEVERERAGVSYDENDLLEARMAFSLLLGAQVPLRAATTDEVAAAAHTQSIPKA